MPARLPAQQQTTGILLVESSPIRPEILLVGLLNIDGRDKRVLAV